jgi:DNA-binding NarL/FixJ family response regulator
MTKRPITILCVDDHPLIREGIAAVIANQPDVVLAGEASSGHEALEQYRVVRPDVVLMDLRMPDLSGIDAITAIRREFPAARIVVLTAYKGDVLIVQALNAGAAGYLLKSALRKELLETIRSVHAGQRRIAPEAASEVAEHRADNLLTDRELDVLRSIATGSSNKIVADHLSISEETVKTHVRSILSKLSANDRTHAVTLALKRGIIQI